MGIKTGLDWFFLIPEGRRPTLTHTAHKILACFTQTACLYQCICQAPKDHELTDNNPNAALQYIQNQHRGIMCWWWRWALLTLLFTWMQLWHRYMVWFSRV